ncbi:uncharacterized protein GGS25DRAFT_511606 [Hypoxylon fragiforme]|uniref:uncharacterized protein n=1 Tax=Hypoxylon fragiforme TaxID=63214 RepID=UPI0020C66791|nr:uncharacterized protein GGS25DRAFT_511606 [Hypoxylon fragiforme]KAI2603497.1 hypothetical protein GGS25DRAFT_511606 [Hypoxylon fragiforme]
MKPFCNLPRYLPSIVLTILVELLGTWLVLVYHLNRSWLFLLSTSTLYLLLPTIYPFSPRRESMADIVQFSTTLIFISQ